MNLPAAAICIESTCGASKPGFTFAKRAKLRINSPAPVSNIIESATSATTSAPREKLPPAATLRARGSLESTVRHEILHLLIEDRADPATPLWFREGVVLHLAGAGREPRPRPTAAAPGNLDRALRHPAGPEEMRRSYAEALARVDSLVAAHGEARVLAWLERGGPPLPGG